MAARETTTNVRSSLEEKETWRQYAPGGNLSKWFRRLAEAEIERQKRK